MTRHGYLRAFLYALFSIVLLEHKFDLYAIDMRMEPDYKYSIYIQKG
jgi:hypothetical protein